MSDSQTISIHRIVVIYASLCLWEVTITICTTIAQISACALCCGIQSCFRLCEEWVKVIAASVASLTHTHILLIIVTDVALNL